PDRMARTAGRSDPRRAAGNPAGDGRRRPPRRSRRLARLGDSTGSAGMKETESRAAERDAFVAAQGLARAPIAVLADDASFRRYYRLSPPSGSLVLMDAPPPNEDVRPFARL